MKRKISAGIAIVFLLGLAALAYSTSGKDAKPEPEQVKMANPIMDVDSLEELETYLDFALPQLNKEVSGYSFIVVDDYPSLGQINYADGSEFRMAHGSEDVSGIYGGSLESSEMISGVEVCFYHYADGEFDIDYATWEDGGFSFSYIYTGDGTEEIGELILNYQGM